MYIENDLVVLQGTGYDLFPIFRLKRSLHLQDLFSILKQEEIIYLLPFVCYDKDIRFQRILRRR